MKGRTPIRIPGDLLPCAVAGGSANGACDATVRQGVSVMPNRKGVAMESRK